MPRYWRLVLELILLCFGFRHGCFIFYGFVGWYALDFYTSFTALSFFLSCSLFCLPIFIFLTFSSSFLYLTFLSSVLFLVICCLVYSLFIYLFYVLISVFSVCCSLAANLYFSLLFFYFTFYLLLYLWLFLTFLQLLCDDIVVVCFFCVKFSFIIVNVALKFSIGICLSSHPVLLALSYFFHSFLCFS